MADDPIDPAPYAVWAHHAERRELALQVTPGGAPAFPPRVGAGAQWTVSAGRGTVYATTTVHPREGDPYDLSLVDLDEGPRLMSRVVGCAPQDVRVGARVILEWEDGESDVALPVAVFRIDGEAR